MPPLGQTAASPGLLEQGRTCMQQGRLGEAVRCFDKAAKTGAGVQGWLLSGLALQGGGNHAEALKRFDRVRKLQPEHPQAVLHTGMCKEMLGDYETALKCYAWLLKRDPAAEAVHRQKLKLLEMLPGRLELAQQAAEQATQCCPNVAEFYLTQARLAIRQGELTLAEAAIGRARTCPIPGPMVAARLHEAEAMLLEKRKDYAGAYSEFARSNACAAQHPQAQRLLAEQSCYDALIERYRAFFSESRCAAWAKPLADKQKTPVFLVGFPRSGTTLCEEMFAAHPKVATSQEIDALHFTLAEAARLTGQAVTSAPAFLEALTPEQCSQLRKFYWQQVYQLCPEARQKPVFFDKLPMNLVELGFIQRIFPEARIIVALRDPRDVVLSNFKQLFVPNAAMVHFYTLADTARFYAAVMGLWLHYQPILKLAILPYHYEDLVADTETQIRALIAHAGLEWSDKVLQFHAAAHKRQIRTPSFTGAGGPVYRKAVGSWQRYAGPMQPVLPMLQPFVDSFGYAST